MIMDEITQVMKEYLSTVSNEQFEQDLIQAGILNSPEKTWVEIPAGPLVLGSFKAGQQSSWSVRSSMTYKMNTVYVSTEETNNILFEAVA